MPGKRPLVVTFTKMNGAGNDFIVLDNRFLHFTEEELAGFARRFCPRRTGVGADGVLALDAPDADGHDFRMRYHNADGSPAGLCGNGARCLARFARSRAGLGTTPAAQGSAPSGANDRENDAELRFASDAGTHRATVPADPDAPVRFYVPAPKGFAENVTLRTDGLAARLPGPVSFVNTGTEHAVLFVEDAAAAPVADWGPPIRQDAAFAPEGANANVVEVASPRGGERGEARLAVRTFEKGVEGETRACGTGALAAAVVAWRTGRVAGPPVAIEMPGGELRVGFRAAGGGAGDAGNASIEDLYLEGPAEATFQGTVEVCF
jgi:diaminopimelate epimerase